MFYKQVLTQPNFKRCAYLVFYNDISLYLSFKGYNYVIL